MDLLCLFLVPTRLADGFGLKELPYSWYARRFTPLEVWFLRFSYENSAGYSFCLGLAPPWVCAFYATRSCLRDAHD